VSYALWSTKNTPTSDEQAEIGVAKGVWRNLSRQLPIPPATLAVVVQSAFNLDGLYDSPEVPEEQEDLYQDIQMLAQESAALPPAERIRMVVRGTLEGLHKNKTSANVSRVVIGAVVVASLYVFSQSLGPKRRRSRR
jgi:hypothetical protein